MSRKIQKRFGRLRRLEREIQQGRNGAIEELRKMRANLLKGHVGEVRFRAKGFLTNPKESSHCFDLVNRPDVVALGLSDHLVAEAAKALFQRGIRPRHEDNFRRPWIDRPPRQEPDVNIVQPDRQKRRAKKAVKGLKRSARKAAIQDRRQVSYPLAVIKSTKRKED